MTDLTDGNKTYLRDLVLLVTAGFRPKEVDDIAEEHDTDFVHFMASVLRGEDEDEPVSRPEGEPLSLDTIAHDDLIALAEKALSDPDSITLNGVRLLADFILTTD